MTRNSLPPTCAAPTCAAPTLAAPTLAAPVFAALLLAAGCAAAPIGPSPGDINTPAGYADGTKTVATPYLQYTVTGKGVVTDSSGNISAADVTATIRTRITRDVIWVMEPTRMWQSQYWNTGTNSWLGWSADSYLVKETADGQARLIAYVMGAQGTSAGNQDSYIIMGLPTRPSVVDAMSVGASYSGPARLAVHYADGAGGYGNATGTAALNVTLAPGGPPTLQGTMTFTPVGSDSAAHAIAPGTTITIDPATISGNGFATTLSLTPADIGLSSVATTDMSGQFYGPTAGIVGATFNGTGTAADGTTPVVFHGGLLAN